MASCGISHRGVGMGIGTIGSNMVIKRKFRWTLEWEDAKSYKLIAPESFVRVTARPNMTFEETEILHGSSKHWIPGKSGWEEMTVTYLDTTHDEGGALFLYWVAQQYQRGSSQPVKIDPALATLRLYDGCGCLMETWLLENAIVTGIRFGDLEYTNYDDKIAEATIRYSRVYYENNTPPHPLTHRVGMGVGTLPAPAAVPPPP